uniref:Tetraspanin n=1 Tax=Plectus sambesii TaxID=2011161 RepID=A0A914VJ26_9BILA
MVKKGRIFEKLGTWPITDLVIQLVCFGLLIASWLDGNHKEIHAALVNTKTNDFQSSLYTHFILHQTATILCGVGILAYIILIIWNIFSIKRNATDANSPISRQRKNFCTILRSPKFLVGALVAMIQILCSAVIVYLAQDELRHRPQKEIEILLRDVIVTNPAAMRALEATNKCCGVRLKTGKINHPHECLSPVSVPTCTDQVSDSLIGFARCFSLLALSMIAIAVMGIILVRKYKCIRAKCGQEPKGAPVAKEMLPQHVDNPEQITVL